MVGKIDTAQGRRIYPQRLAIAEPVFANIRINKRLDRFTLRGKIKVNIQWLMYCLVHNIDKDHELWPRLGPCITRKRGEIKKSNPR
jgi:hypothetical protein